MALACFGGGAQHADCSPPATQLACRAAAPGAAERLSEGVSWLLTATVHRNMSTETRSGSSTRASSQGPQGRGGPEPARRTAGLLPGAAAPRGVGPRARGSTRNVHATRLKRARDQRYSFLDLSSLCLDSGTEAMEGAGARVAERLPARAPRATAWPVSVRSAARRLCVELHG